MPRLELGVLIGVGLGTIACLLMLPLRFEDKRRAMLAAFVNRFSIGAFLGMGAVAIDPIAGGAIIGALTSLPSGIVTKKTPPILVTGIVLGALGGWAMGRWGR